MRVRKIGMISLGSLIAAASVLSASLVALAKSPAPRVHLTVWTDVDPIGIKWWHKEVTQFEKLHPNISVTVYQESLADNYAKYTTAITGHKAPDLMLTYSYPIVPSWAASGFLDPMTKYLNQLDFRDKTFFPFINALDNFHGKTWGLVQAYDDTLLTWNKAAFKAAGLNPNDPPKTLTQLLADAKKLTIIKNGKLVQAGIVPWTGMGTLRVWDNLEGGEVYENGHWLLNATSMQHAMQLWATYNKLLGGTKNWQALYESTVGTGNVGVGSLTRTIPSNSPRDPFYSGKVAMSLAGDWYPVFTYPVYAPHLKYGEALPPVAAGVKYGTDPMTGTDVFVLPADSAHPLQATELALFLDGVGPSLYWDKVESNMPPSAAAATSPSFLKNVPTEWPSVDAAKQHLLIPYPATPEWSSIDTQFGTIEQELEYQKITPKQAAKQAEADANQISKTFAADNPQWAK